MVADVVMLGEALKSEGGILVYSKRGVARV